MQKKFNPKIHKRRSVRLKDYDYSQAGVYFVTICSYERKLLFADSIDEKIELNSIGHMIADTWNEISQYYPNFKIDLYVLMPNHIHGIIWKEAQSKVGVAPRGYPIDMTLSDVIHRFKSLTTNKYIQGVKSQKWPRFNKRLWQRNFYEHVIRSESELNAIREYILDNPRKWCEDEYYIDL